LLKSYKASTDVVETLNTCLNEINVVKTFNANWMSMRLKKDDKVVSLMKRMIVQTVKNQSVRDQKIT